MAPESPLPGRGQWARDRSAILSALHLVVSDCESGMTTPGCVCVWGGVGWGVTLNFSMPTHSSLAFVCPC